MVTMVLMAMMRVEDGDGSIFCDDGLLFALTSNRSHRWRSRIHMLAFFLSTDLVTMTLVLSRSNRTAKWSSS